MRFIVFSFVLFAAAVSEAGSGPDRLTLYLDGARVETEAAARGGYLEIFLPPAARPTSLRIRPAGSGRIDRVEFMPARTDPRIARSLARLAERRERLEDRLKALETRETVFRSAAKSQSGRAPRKSKSNPEPLTAVRRGTDYAIGQLEVTFRVLRQTRHELADLEQQLSGLQREGNVGGTVARVWLADREGRVIASYVRSDLSWKPSYDFRLSGTGRLEATVRPIIPEQARGKGVSVVMSTLGDGASREKMPAGHALSTGTATFFLPVELIADADPVTITFRNASGRKLPAGVASCYRDGAFTGQAPFTGALPGEVREVVCGSAP